MVILEIGEYRFAGHRQGMVMVYRDNLFIESFNVHQGIESRVRLEEEAGYYLKTIKQKY